MTADGKTILLSPVEHIDLEERAPNKPAFARQAAAEYHRDRGSRILVIDDLSDRAVEKYQRSGPGHYAGLSLSFARACREADAARARAVGEAKRTRRPEPTGDAPQVTLEAIVQDFRDRGKAALADPVNKHRVSALSERQRTELARRLKR
jgi:hypothetical protein